MCKKAEEDGILVLVMALMILVTSFEIQETKMNEMGSPFQIIITTPPPHIITHTLKPMVVGIAQKQLNQRWPHEGKFGPPLFFNALIISPFICPTSELPAVHLFMSSRHCISSMRPLFSQATVFLHHFIALYKILSIS